MENIRGCRNQIILFLGGGLFIAILGILGLFLDIIQIGQTDFGSTQDDRINSTMIALQEQQLQVQQQLATAQSNPDGLSGTEIAENIEGLLSTAQSLEVEKEIVIVTATAAEFNVPKIWHQSVSEIPDSGTTISREVDRDQVFVITGGRLNYENTYCGDNEFQICVFIIGATRERKIEISSVIPKHNWVGVTSGFTLDELLIEIQDQFWEFPNCGIGCQFATVFLFSDQTILEKQVLQSP